MLRYEIEFHYRPSILDNIKHWQVFEDEEQVKLFMETIGEFSNLTIDAEEEETKDSPKNKWQDTVAGHKVLQLKGNVIPRGLVPLERLFDKNDVPANHNKVVEEEKVEELNLGTEVDPKIVKLSKKVPEEYKEKYLKLFQSYMDVFAWSYQDLKAFDISIIQLKIPLREDAKLHKKKLRQINPLVLPSIQNEIKKLLKAIIIVPLRYSNRWPIWS